MLEKGKRRKNKHVSLKSIQEQDVANNSLLTTENFSNISEEINQELCWQKHLNKKLKSQLLKTEDSNSELILAVKDFKEELNRKNKELMNPHQVVFL